MAGESRIGIVVLAAGNGTRFGRKMPKQYNRIWKVPVFIAATLPFVSACGSSIARIVIICPPSRVKYTERLTKMHLPANIPVSVIGGGEKRIDSLFRSTTHLAASLQSDDLVLIHDGARPMLHSADIQGQLSDFAARDLDASMLVKPTAESLFKYTRPGRIAGLNREEYCLAETPTLLKMHVLSDLYQKWAHKTGSFHQSVDILELASRHKKYKIGSYAAKHPNIKLTHPADMALIRFLCPKNPHKIQRSGTKTKTRR